MSETALQQNSLEGELPRGTTVYAVNGEQVGQVFLSALRDGYFIVEQGWLFSHELFLPATAIARRDARGLGLTLAKGDLRQPRWRVPPDEWLIAGSLRPIVPPTRSEDKGSPTTEEDVPLAERDPR